MVRQFERNVGRVKLAQFEMLTEIGAETAELIREMIGREQPQWLPLADSTVEQKAKKGWGRDGDPSSPLYATGEMAESVTYHVHSDTFAQIGTDDPIAVFHEYGTSHIPPRPMFNPFYIDEFLRGIINYAGRWIHKAID
jgi:phage gpG-like protein